MTLPKKHIRPYILTLCVLMAYAVFFSSHSLAQPAESAQITITTEPDIHAQNESIVALTLQIENHSPALFNGYLVLKEVNGISMVGHGRIKVEQNGNSQFYYPMRLSISKMVPAGTTPVVLQLFDTNDELRASFQSRLHIESVSNIRLISHRSTQLMKQVGDSLEISAMLRNEGNTIEEIIVTASFPNLRGGNAIEQQHISVQAFQDTVVTFSRIITNELLEVSQYTVNVAALYEDGRLINNVMVSVQNASGTRTYHDPLHQGFSYNSFSPNSISLSSRNMFANNEALQVNGRGTFQLGKGSLAFNLDSYIYTKNSLDPLLTNTYLNYEIKNTGIVLGNLNENLETYINGRGVKLYHTNADETQSVEIGISDKNYNLLENRNRLAGDDGYTALAKVYMNNMAKKKRYTGSIIYDRSALQSSENIILMNDYDFAINDNLTAGVELGGGLTRLTTSVDKFKPALAIGANLNGQVGEYTIASNNFFSTAYYPGVRRGLINLNERIGRRFHTTNVWLGYNYYNYDPEYLRSHLFYNSQSTNSSVEAGVYFPFSTNFSLSLAGKVQADQASVYSPISSVSTMQQMNSLRFRETLSWRSNNDQHLVNLTAENGFGRVLESDKKLLQIRSSLSWSYRMFTLNAYYQQGNFTVREAYGSFGEEGTIRRFNISPGVQKSFLDNRLRTTASINYNHDSYVGSNWSFSTNTSYEFSPRFSAFLSAYVYDYSSSFYNSSYANIQSGISYKLPAANQVKSTKSGNIMLFLFYDKNANGIYDEGDAPASDRIVTIGDITFVSLADGTIVYKKVPYGSYRINVPSSDWYASIPDKIQLNAKNFNLTIPLQETGRITGDFVYNYDERISEEVSPQVSGLRVWLIDHKGNRIRSLSNTNGKFTLFAPVGEYSIHVDEESLPTNVFTEFEPSTLRIEKGKTITLPTIELKVKQKKVEVKRFSS